VSAETQAPTDGLADWRQRSARERWEWWDQRWNEAINLSERYRLALRSGWWEDSVRVEALAAFAAWVATYDTEVRIDPPGKLQLLGQLEWLRVVLRGGERAFDPPTDRRAFDRYLTSIGCRPPDGRPPAPPDDPRLERQRQQLADELAAIDARLRELGDRERALNAELEPSLPTAADHARRDLSELERTVDQLRGRQEELRGQLGQTAGD